MSFAAEPYGIFVDDLVAGLTGGVTREDFVFLTENAPFRLAGGADVVPDTVRISGLAEAEFFRFRAETDFHVDPDGAIRWLEGDAGVPARGATWPDEGSHFFASYELRPGVQAPPLLTDRNPGSVVRTLAESFAREYAVLSRQLELVYEGAFLETSSGRDLEQLVALVGLERQSRAVAAGEVVFSRSTPAPGDVFVPAGTVVVSGDVPVVSVETTQDATLRSGTLSVAAPVRAQVAGPEGVAPANSLTVIRRPILGIETVTNPTAMIFGGDVETDESLRRRASRALERAGGSTVGALTAALTSVAGIRDRDVRIVEDHLAFPGLLKVTVAGELDATHQALAAALIDEFRPAGVRVIHNLAAAPVAPLAPSPDPHAGGGAPAEPPPAPSEDNVFFDVGAAIVVTPAAANLSAPQKATLTAQVQAAANGFVGALGVGEPIVYNRFVAALVGLDGVYDVSLDLFPKGAAATGRASLSPPGDRRPRLAQLDVEIRGALVALDITVAVERKGLAALADKATALSDIRGDISRRLQELLAALAGPINRGALLARLSDTDTYSVKELSYTADFVDEGLRITTPDMEIQPAGDQQPWLRSLTVGEEPGTT